MAAIDKLPRELLDEILSQLPNADLVYTSLVSHRLYEVSIPLLYKAPVLLWARHRTKRQCLQIFLWTLLTPGRETIATNVHSLTWYRYSNQPGQCPSMNALLASVVMRFGLEHTLDLQADLFVLLLHLLPCLRVIRIKNSGEFAMFSLSMSRHSTALALSVRTPTPLLLQSLREFHSVDGGARGAATQQTLVVLMALPCIEIIEIRIDNSEFTSIPVMLVPAASSTVTRLRICDRSDAPAYLSRILSIPRGLTHFSYSTVGRRSKFDLAMFRAAVQQLSRSVVCLYLDVALVGPQNSNWFKRFGSEETTWSLVEWEALRTLSCTLVTLMGKRTPAKLGGLGALLPSGIRELEVVGEPDWRYAPGVGELVRLLAGKEMAVSRLQMVTARPPAAVVRKEGDEEALENLREVCERAGVTLGNTHLRW